MGDGLAPVRSKRKRELLPAKGSSLEMASDVWFLDSVRHIFFISRLLLSLFVLYFKLKIHGSLL